MVTTVEIDETLVQQAMNAQGFETKKAAVEEALQLMIRMNAQERIRRLRGKIHWEGDLETSRLARGEE